MRIKFIYILFFFIFFSGKCRNTKPQDIKTGLGVIKEIFVKVEKEAPQTACTFNATLTGTGALNSSKLLLNIDEFTRKRAKGELLSLLAAFGVYQNGKATPVASSIHNDFSDFLLSNKKYSDNILFDKETGNLTMNFKRNLSELHEEIKNKENVDISNDVSNIEVTIGFNEVLEKLSLSKTEKNIEISYEKEQENSDTRESTTHIKVEPKSSTIPKETMKTKLKYILKKYPKENIDTTNYGIEVRIDGVALKVALFGKGKKIIKINSNPEGRGGTVVDYDIFDNNEDGIPDNNKK